MTVIDELIEEFADLDQREANQLLDELGRTLPQLPESVYDNANLVPGCQSRVWMVNSIASDGTLEIQADSDAIVVKGLVYLLLQIYVGKTPEEALAHDYVETFERFGLSRLITPQRKNGLYSMVKRLHEFSAASTNAEVESFTQNNAANIVDVAPTRSVDGIAADFPILNRDLPNGKRPVFLDSGASAQKPTAVIEAQRECEEQYYANAFRGRYYFGQRVDDAIEATRAAVANLIGASRVEEIVFTSGTTMSINLVATAWGRKNLNPGDEVVITEMEHHANFVPWQAIVDERDATLRIIPVTDGELELREIDSLINAKTKMVAICTMSNVLGTINPIDRVIAAAHKVGAVVLADAAQSIPHQGVNVTQQDIDFLVFSGHKLYGPSGIGVLYGKYDLLDSMDPFMYGGHMIQEVGERTSTWAPPPAKFEAGTMAITQIAGLGAAVQYVQSVGFKAIAAHEHKLLEATHAKLESIEGLTIHGPSTDKKGAIVSFSIEGISTEDLAIRLDDHGVFTRHGHHCAMVLHQRLGVPATTRASFGMYNTLEDVDVLYNAVKQAVDELRR